MPASECRTRTARIAEAVGILRQLRCNHKDFVALYYRLRAILNEDDTPPCREDPPRLRFEEIGLPRAEWSKIYAEVKARIDTIKEDELHLSAIRDSNDPANQHYLALAEHVLQDETILRRLGVSKEQWRKIERDSQQFAS